MTIIFQGIILSAYTINKNMHVRNFVEILFNNLLFDPVDFEWVNMQL